MNRFKSNNNIIVLLIVIVFILKAIKEYYLIIVPSFILISVLFLIKYRNDNYKIKRYEYDFSHIDSMKGNDFAVFLGKVYRNKGYQVKLNPFSNDFGADLILSVNGSKKCVQAKRSSSKVGISAVQEVLGSINYYGANEGIVVTNNFFTSNAKTLAQTNHIKLIDRDDLKGMLSKLYRYNGK